MASSQIPIWRCIYGRTYCTTPLNIVNLLSENKSDGENQYISHEHVLQFVENWISNDLGHEGVMCRIFTLTFEGLAKEWCESLLAASIHTWDQFVSYFFYEFQDYDYDKICLELENLRRLEGESMIHFVIRFKSIFLKFYFMINLLMMN
jgi:hypothetical protein